jgi:hypothetical protein
MLRGGCPLGHAQQLIALIAHQIPERPATLGNLWMRTSAGSVNIGTASEKLPPP